MLQSSNFSHRSGNVWYCYGSSQKKPELFNNCEKIDDEMDYTLPL